MAIDLSASEQVGPALLEYLAARLGVAGLQFAEPPEQITHGWETYTYSFRIVKAGREPAWAEPLILRIYPGDDQALKAEQEAAIQRYAAGRGYPAPRPLAAETDPSILGRPFMIMERARGEPMLDLMAASPTKAVRFAALLADTHVALHRLPVDGCPLPSDGSLIDRQLTFVRETLTQLGLELPADARTALCWLQAHKDAVMEEEVALCHHDFHPLNIMVDGEERVTVLDWPMSALGDRHSDIASTVVLLRTAPIDPPRLIERLLARFGRGIFVWLYLRRYRRHLPIDAERLRYWEAFRAFVWWVELFAFESVDLALLGVKPDTAARIPAGHLVAIQRYFWRRAKD